MRISLLLDQDEAIRLLRRTDELVRSGKDAERRLWATIHAFVRAAILTPFGEVQGQEIRCRHCGAALPAHFEATCVVVHVARGIGITPESLYMRDYGVAPEPKRSAKNGRTR